MPTQEPSTARGTANCVVTFYHFVSVETPAQLCEQVEVHARKLELKGTVLIASEGINGTLAGTADAAEAMVAVLQGYPEFAEMPVKYSSANPDNRVFHRLKVRHKPEIVAMGVPGVDPAAATGVHVDVAQWHQLLQDPNVPVIDVRNVYETRIGSFVGAQDPATQSFREFPEYAKQNLDPQAQPRIAMFCTGGVRCEKASAYLLEQGFAEVYQLNGGILNYLAEVDPAQSQWQGECFVFDQRVSVNDALGQGDYVQCFACRSALTAADVASEHYVEGRSCPHCYQNLTAEQRASFAERQKQIGLAAQRGDTHIGASFSRRTAQSADPKDGE